MNPLIGTVIGGKYRLEKQLGQGGMGMVFAATQIGLNRKCAVKLLHEALSQDHQLVARFKREAEVAASIGHPNIIQVTDFGYEDGKVFLVMDLLQGMPLAHAIQTGAPLSAERVRFIATQVLSALDAAHQRDIVHRDLKPDNIYLTSLSGVADVVKLLDFGIARMTSEQSQKMTTTGQVLGTPAYMSPEQARGKEVALRTDLYSLGVVMYEALSGRMPVEGSNYHELMFNIVGETPMPLEEYRPDLPKALLDIVAKSMAKLVSDRYQSAMEMKRELDALGPIDATAPAAVQVPSDPPRTIDTDPFAKTITPEAVLPVDSQRPPRQSATGTPVSQPGVGAVDSQPRVDAVERWATPIWVGAMLLAIGGVSAGVWAATRPDPVVADTTPTETTESQREVERREQLERIERLLEQQRLSQMTDMQGDENPVEDVEDVEPTSEMTSMSEMSSMSEMTSRSEMTSSSSSSGRPAHARYTLIEPPPPDTWRRHQCCPDAWHDGRNIPVVWATCGDAAHEMYPVLPRTNLRASSWRGNNVVANDQFRPWTERHAAALTGCYRGHAILNGQLIQISIDAEGRVTRVGLREYCPVPGAVKSCISDLLVGEQLPPDRDAPGEIAFSLGVAGT